MALERNLMSVRRLRICENTDLGSWWDLTETLAQGLAEHAFDGVWLGQTESISGWVRPDDPMSVDFSDLNAWRMSPIGWLCCRVDERKVQSALLRARVERACKDWCRERGVEKVPGAVKKEIKEQIWGELISGSQPKMSTYHLAVDLESRSVLVAANAESRVDDLRRRLFRHFGWNFETDSPYRWVENPDPVVEKLDMEPDRIGSAFLLWLWYQSAGNKAGADVIVEGKSRRVTWNTGNQVELIRSGERWSARKIESGLDHHAVARQAIADHYMPTALDLELGIDDENVYFPFRMKAPDCQVSALSGQPGPEDASGDHPLMESVWMRVSNVRTLYAAIEALFGCFCEDLMSDRFSVPMVRRQFSESLTS
jgi:hypothetical protein